LVLDAQGAGELKLAAAPKTMQRVPTLQRASFDRRQPEASPVKAQPNDPLTGSFVRFFSDCGVMKFAVDATLRSIR
jgi:hypothetical protein